MSHFPVVVLTDESVDRDSAEQAVTPLLEPYCEDGEWFREGSRWDWWVIGGRWTGMLSSYDPREDIANYEVCDLCEGTGVRPDGHERFGADWVEECNGCNGCNGNGMCLAFGFEPHDGDVQPVAALREADFVPSAVVTPDGEWHEQGRPGWWGMTIKDEDGHDEKPEELWSATVAALLEQHPEATAVLVDCHV